MALKIAIAGVTSKLALCVVEELLKHPEVQLRGSCRDIAKLPALYRDNPHVTLVQTDPFEVEPLRKLIHGCKVVICCYYADDETMLKAQTLLIGLCEEQQVDRYIASDWTVDYTKLDWGDIVMKDPMKHIKTYLDDKSKLQGVHILTGAFMEVFWAYYVGWDPVKKELSFWGSGDEQTDITSYRTAGQYTAAAALDPAIVGVTRVVGERKSAKEVASDYEALTGCAITLKSLGSLDSLHELIGSGEQQNPLAAAQYLTLTGKCSLGQELDNDKFPMVHPETMRDLLSKEL